MSRTKISWCDYSWSPVIGCSKVSEGCQKCWAEKMACRLNQIFAAKGDNDNWADYTSILKFDYSKDEMGKPIGWNGDVCLRYNQLDKPLHWKSPRKIFVGSMSDLFGKKVPFEFIDKIFYTMYCSHRLGHIFQILTKQPKRMLEYLSGDVDMRILQMFPEWKTNSEVRLTTGVPYPNLWLGVSVELPKYKNRIDILRQTPAAHRFISVEPCLADMGELDLTGISLVIIGCESMPGGRAGRFQDGFIEAALSIVRQCKAAGVKCHVKQVCKNGRVVHALSQFPKELRIREL